jgi:hypothetical protein
MAVFGFRSHAVFEGVTEGVLDSHGAYLYAEVTNDGQSDVYFFPNPILPSGIANPAVPAGIPIKAGTTRAIPMSLYTFKASGPVTVVAYRS